MKERDILERIVNEKGNCEWAFKHNPADPNYICELCPMSRLAKRSDGSYVSCIEALGLTDQDCAGSTADQAYLKKAEELLLDMDIEDALKGKSPDESE